MNKLVFLGGTVGENHWREELVIPELVSRGIDPNILFNPVVKDWNEEAQRREDEAKQTAQLMLFVIANPMVASSDVSAYSLVEAVMALYDAPERTVLVLSTPGMSTHTAKAMRKAFQDLRRRHPKAAIFDDIATAVEWLAMKLAF